jgi:hypothetical protein
MNPSVLPALISVRAASRRVGIPGRELLAVADEAGIRTYRVGRRTLLAVDDLAEFLSQRRRCTLAEHRTRWDLISELAAEAIVGNSKQRTRKGSGAS